MSIRKKILRYFSISICLIIGVSFFVIYYLSAEYREENFQLRQKEKIATILEILVDVKNSEDELISTLTHISIQELTNDKLLLFNSKKELIYSNLVDVKVNYSKFVLNRLSSTTKWIEEKDGKEDVLGIYIKKEGKSYYGISIAFDDFGYSKLHFLGFTLLFSFISITVVIAIVSFYISKNITAPLITLTEKIKGYNPSNEFKKITIPNSSDETTILAQSFNSQLKQINELFSFQNHTIHHISHQLKTPIAILVSNFERIEKESDLTKLKHQIHKQKVDTMALGEIISSLLEIAKIESGQSILKEEIRVDELIFDIAERLKNIYPEAIFNIQYMEPVDHNRLILIGNQRLITSALFNLMENSIQYSSNQESKITIDTTKNSLQILIQNNGNTLDLTEQEYLFEHFFRGKNSKGKKGFGLGLIFTKKIIALHKGEVRYEATSNELNTFTLSF